ncbi:hypothetical protein, partial [Mesorhizobium sp.]
IDDLERLIANRSAECRQAMDGAKQVRGFQVADHRQAQGQTGFLSKAADMYNRQSLGVYSAPAGSL